MENTIDTLKIAAFGYGKEMPKMTKALASYVSQLERKILALEKDIAGVANITDGTKDGIHIRAAHGGSAMKFITFPTDQVMIIHDGITLYVGPSDVGHGAGGITAYTHGEMRVQPRASNCIVIRSVGI